MEWRVVTTGLGLISPLGIGKEPFWLSLVKEAQPRHLFLGRPAPPLDPEHRGCGRAGKCPLVR